MYVRGCVDGFGRHTNRPRPGGNLRVALQTTVVPVRPARTICVATASTRTVALLRRRNVTKAASRNPSPFGLTVVRRRRSPANGVDPFETAISNNGEGGAAVASEATGRGPNT